MKKLIKRIIKEELDFNWADDIKDAGEKESFIINLIDSCEKVPFQGGFLYVKDDNIYFQSYNNGGDWYWDFVNVYEVLKSEFGLNSDEQHDLIYDILVDHYKFVNPNVSLHQRDE